MRRAVSALFVLSLVTVGWMGCGSAGGTPVDTPAGAAGANGNAAGNAGTSNGGASASGGGGMSISLGGSGVAAPSHLLGKVFAPNGTIPISGALVYLADAPPPAIPDGVYCDKCVHLDQSIPYTTSGPDGSFDLAVGGSGGYLVVQKGAFRRVRHVDVVPGDNMVAADLTTMPPKMDKANGDDVPKMAVVLGAWDPIEVVLARMGLEAKITTDPFGKAQVLSADAVGFAVYGLHGIGEQAPHPDATKLLTDPNEINQYQIVFIPCSGSPNNGDGSGTDPACSGVWDPSAMANLQQFVKQGGRVYASDWSYEYVRQSFQGFVSWQGETQQIGSACMGGGGEQMAKSDDDGLGAWLSAQGQSLSSVKDAWTYLDGVHPVMDVDADGKPVTETPKVWVEAEGQPSATSFKHGCGRVLYSTYHTQPSAETNAPLEPQALSLLYMILEVGVCIDFQDPG